MQEETRPSFSSDLSPPPLLFKSLYIARGPFLPTFSWQEAQRSWLAGEVPPPSICTSPLPKNMLEPFLFRRYVLLGYGPWACTTKRASEFPGFPMAKNLPHLSAFLVPWTVAQFNPGLFSDHPPRHFLSILQLKEVVSPMTSYMSPFPPGLLLRFTQATEVRLQSTLAHILD